MQKLQPSSLNADWSKVPERTPFQYITSMELSRVLGVPLTSVNNWRIRGVLPEPVNDNPKLHANKNHYRIASILAWLESRDEQTIIREWLIDAVGADDLTDGQVAYLSGIYSH